MTTPKSDDHAMPSSCVIGDLRRSPRNDVGELEVESKKSPLSYSNAHCYASHGINSNVLVSCFSSIHNGSKRESCNLTGRRDDPEDLVKRLRIIRKGNPIARRPGACSLVEVLRKASDICNNVIVDGAKSDSTHSNVSNWSEGRCRDKDESTINDKNVRLEQVATRRNEEEESNFEEPALSRAASARQAVLPLLMSTSTQLASSSRPARATRANNDVEASLESRSPAERRFACSRLHDTLNDDNGDLDVDSFEEPEQNSKGPTLRKRRICRQYKNTLYHTSNANE